MLWLAPLRIWCMHLMLFLPLSRPCVLLSQAPFKRLEVLILERNRLEADQEFLSLANAPRLRELNMAFNYFKRVPKKAGHPMSFRMLEWLNLANNFIASEHDVLALVKFPRLLQVILYGNPITDSKRRREEVHKSAKPAATNAGLDQEEGSGRIVNLVTDVPVPNARSKGAYNTFRITKVVDRGGPSATQWREAGNRALFGDDSDYDEADEDDEVTEELAALKLQKQKRKKKKKKKRKADRPSRECVSPCVLASRLVYHCNGVGCLITVRLIQLHFVFFGGCILCFCLLCCTSDEKTSLFITATGDDGVSVDSSSEEETDSDDEEGLSVPAMLLQRSLQGPGGPGSSDPARLRAAINALRHVLKHPLTSHVSKSSKMAVERPTKLQKVCTRGAGRVDWGG